MLTLRHDPLVRLIGALCALGIAWVLWAIAAAPARGPVNETGE